MREPKLNPNCAKYLNLVTSRYAGDSESKPL